MEKNNLEEKTETLSTGQLIQSGRSQLEMEDMLAIKQVKLSSKNVVAEFENKRASPAASTISEKLEESKDLIEYSLNKFYDKSLYLKIENKSFILKYYSKIKTSHPEVYATLDKV